MFKKVTTVITENKSEIVNKALILGGITAGMIISSIVSKGKTPSVIVSETVTDDVASEPEAPAEEK